MHYYSYLVIGTSNICNPERLIWCRIWSWSPMPCENHGPRDSVDKNRGRSPRFLSLLRPEGHVFHMAWETMIKSYYIFVCLFCFITKSFLTYSFFPPTHALPTISRPLSSSMCSITRERANVCRSCNCMQDPDIGCWFSDRSNCSHWSFEAAVLPINPNIYTDQWEPIVMYHSITFTFTGPYTTMQPTLLTYWLQLLSYKV